jgi:SAM-dependent methyltransferase
VTSRRHGPDGAFDDAIASLVLQYFEDWTAPLAELRRGLKPGGRLIASVNHPIAGHPLVRPGVDYWATYEWSDEITTASGQSYVLANWHRPLPAMIEAFTGAGFRIAAISEPPPAPDMPRELLPDFLQDKPSGAGFLCFILGSAANRHTGPRSGAIAQVSGVRGALNRGNA